MLAAKELIHSLFNHFISRGSNQEAAFQAAVEHLTESGADEKAYDEAAAQDDENNNESCDEFIIAIREKWNRTNNQIGEGFDAIANNAKEPAKGKDENGDW